MNHVAKRLRNVIDANTSALSHLSNIRLRYLDHVRKPWESKVGRITKEYDQCLSSIRTMAENALSTEEGNLVYVFNKQMADAEKRGEEAVLKLEAIIDGICSEKESVEKELYENVEKLNLPVKICKYNMESKIKTAHDCIRYLHQVAINNTFDEKPHKKIFMGNLGVVGILDISNNNLDLRELEKNTTASELEGTGNLALEALYNGYLHCAKGDYYCGSFHDIKVLADDNSILSQISLGCHSLKLESKIDESDPFISLDYCDTVVNLTDTGAKDNYRPNYLGLILQKLGYAVEIKGTNVKAMLSRRSKLETYKTLQETVRLLVSSKDLDVLLRYEETMHGAAYFFLKGETNIPSFIEKLDQLGVSYESAKNFVTQFGYQFDDKKEEMGQS